MSGRRVLIIVAAILGVAGWYMWAISMPAKRAAQAQNAARRDAAGANTGANERVPAPSAMQNRVEPTPSPAEMAGAWMDPRAAAAFRALEATAATRWRDAPTPGLASDLWFDRVMRRPYSAIAATPGERTKADVNLRDYRRRATALFDLVGNAGVAPAEALIRYRELDAARVARDRVIFGDERSARLEQLRAAALDELAASVAR